MTQEHTAETVTIPTDGRNTGIRRGSAYWRGWRPGMWRRGFVLALVAVLAALVMALHSHIPNTIGNLGSLAETFLPWFGIVIPVVLVLALVRRSATALVALVLPVALWLNLFGGLVVSKEATGGDFTVATHNVDADNPDPAGTAKDLAHSGADVVALEELTPAALPTYAKGLAGAYRYHAVEGTVALWSKYPMSGTHAVDIRIGWKRAMRSVISTPHGEVAVYVAHLPSVRVKVHAGFTANQRDSSANALGEAISAEPQHRVVLLGDLNGTMNDRSLDAVTAQMRSTQGAAGDGYGFSWPAAFPMARIDQIMVRGVDPKSSWTLPGTGSDHLPIAARVEL
ncbi:endonuclease/exonuclease/phosphatase family protein [Streptomyces sp. NBC_01497]|nr:endonuclease/exonuclease/phosphatase family protein [Streptomyces sp. NBC_01497]